MSLAAMNQYRMFFLQTSTLPPRMHQKLFPTKSHDELEETLLYTDIRPQKNHQHLIHRDCMVYLKKLRVDYRDRALSEEIFGHNLSKSSCFQVQLVTCCDLCDFFFCNLRHIPQVPLKWSIIFVKSWNFNWLFLKLNRFICNWWSALPVHRDEGPLCRHQISPLSLRK